MPIEENFGDDFTPTGDDVKPQDIKAQMEKDELEQHKVAEAAKEAEEAKKAEDDAAAAKVAEEEAAAKAADTDVKDDKDDKRSKVIPRERFDKAQEKAKERERVLQAKIQEYEKANETSRLSSDLKKLSNVIEELEDKYEEAVLEGKRDEARMIRRQLSQHRDVLSDAKAQYSTEAAKRETLAEMRYDASLARAESEHPELNPDSDEYDEELTDEVGVLLESFVLRGFTRDVALAKAVKYVVGTVAKKDPDLKDPKRVADDRAESARRKAADAAKKQPASLSTSGLDSDKGGLKSGKIDINRVSQTGFAKISEDELSELRGDTL